MDVIPGLLASQGCSYDSDQIIDWKRLAKCRALHKHKGSAAIVTAPGPAFCACVPLMITAGSSTFDRIRFTPITVARLSTLILLTAQFSWISCRNLPGSQEIPGRPQEVARRKSLQGQRGLCLISTLSFCLRNRISLLCPQSLALA